jgi:hypothetical protein
LRLTRAEAFDLVRRAVGSLVSGDAAAAASLVRSTARALLARDSESLSERNFTRILQDAHDADVVDLRRRGADYEVAAATGAPTVAAQLASAEIANAPPPAKPTAPAPRGMSARGGRGPMGRGGAPPAHILNVCVVGARSAARPAETAASAAAAETPTGTIDSPALSAVADAAPATETPSRGRKRGGSARKSSAKKKATVDSPVETTEASNAEPAKPAARKRATRGGRKKAVAEVTSEPE